MAPRSARIDFFRQLGIVLEYLAPIRIVDAVAELDVPTVSHTDRLVMLRVSLLYYGGDNEVVTESPLGTHLRECFGFLPLLI
jgi:hypothetical protein